MSVFDQGNIIETITKFLIDDPYDELYGSSIKNLHNSDYATLYNLSLTNKFLLKTINNSDIWDSYEDYVNNTSNSIHDLEIYHEEDKVCSYTNEKKIFNDESNTHNKVFFVNMILSAKQPIHYDIFKTIKINEDCATETLARFTNKVYEAVCDWRNTDSTLNSRMDITKLNRLVTIYEVSMFDEMIDDHFLMFKFGKYEFSLYHKNKYHFVTEYEQALNKDMILYCIFEDKKYEFFKFTLDTKYNIIANRKIVNNFMFDIGILEKNTSFTIDSRRFESLLIVMSRLLNLDWDDSMLNFFPSSVQEIKDKHEKYVIHHNDLSLIDYQIDKYFK